MKMFKKIAAASTALVMAVSMMSFGASALTTSTWTVRYTPGAPSYYNVPEEIDELSPTKNISSFIDTCTSFNQTSNNGTSAKVTLEAYQTSSSGKTTLYLNTYTKTGSDLNRNLSRTVNAGEKLTVSHKLSGNGNSCSMSGDTAVS